MSLSFLVYLPICAPWSSGVSMRWEKHRASESTRSELGSCHPHVLAVKLLNLSETQLDYL